MNKLIWFVSAMDHSLLLRNLTNDHHVESRLVSTEDVTVVREMSERRPALPQYISLTQRDTLTTHTFTHSLTRSHARSHTHALTVGGRSADEPEQVISG